MTDGPVIVLHHDEGLCVVVDERDGGAEGKVLLIRPLEPVGGRSTDPIRVPAYRVRTIPRPTPGTIERARNVASYYIKNDKVWHGEKVIGVDFGAEGAVTTVLERKPNGTVFVCTDPPPPKRRR